MCRLYILYDNYCPLFSDLFLLSRVISFLEMRNATGTRARERPLTDSAVKKKAAENLWALLISHLFCYSGAYHAVSLLRL